MFGGYGSRYKQYQINLSSCVQNPYLDFMVATMLYVFM